MALYSECAQLAQESLARFHGLKMNYEAAKAYAFLGLAACHQTDTGYPQRFPANPANGVKRINVIPWCRPLWLVFVGLVVEQVRTRKLRDKTLRRKSLVWHD
jgi:hypothetical protein